MTEKNHWFLVDEPNNFYNYMVGKKVMETDKTTVLEFKLNEKLGGLQRVQFFTEQLTYDGFY